MQTPPRCQRHSIPGASAMTSMFDGLPWYAVHDNIVSLAYWLESNNRFNKISDVVYFIEKPWKWDNEYKEMKAEREVITA